MTPEDEDAAVAALVRSAVTEVYAVPAGEFIAHRTTLVKAAKADQQKEAAKQIGALRKPSVAAWAINQVVRQRPEVLSHLVDVGVRLRHAQSALDAAGIAALRGERDAVLTELVTAAAEVSSASGQTLTPAVEAEIRDTGIAALADEAAAEVIASGGLTRALHYSGFGEVDVADAVARTSTGVVLTRIEGGADAGDGGAPAPEAESGQEPAAEDEPAREPGSSPPPEPDPAEELRADLGRAEQERDRADRELAVCTSRLDQARTRSEATRARIEKLRTDLAAAEAADEEALGEVTTAMQARKAAVAAQEAASEEAARLRAAVEQLG